MNSLEDLRQLKADVKLTPDQVFEAIFAAGSVLNDEDRESQTALEIAIRLLEARRNCQLPDDCDEVVDYLAEECGLYPYVNFDNYHYLTQTIIEAHAVELEEKIYLHSKQMQILLWLLEGDSVVLSAPTSFGKSLLLDAFLQHRRPRTILVIQPTIALIDETRRRIRRCFKEYYQIITTVNEIRDESRPVIFILTQERCLQRSSLASIDFLFVDEFYKLDPDRGDARFETLNLALYQTLPIARQAFMAGPHISKIELGQKWTGNFRFVRTDYKTVTVNVNDRSSSDNRFGRFVSDLKAVENSNSLVFTATPGTAQKLMRELCESGISYNSKLGPQLGSWIRRNYHADWPIALGNERGLAIHHGRLPRSLLFVHLFNSGEISLLICTSTLIEGVNTSAENVFIYDKKINRSDFDFFSFADIRGRVGRMMRHFVGNAFLYHEAPAENETNVDVPILSKPDTSTDYVLMNVNGEDLSVNGKKRQEDLPLFARLSAETLRQHGSIGTEVLILLREKIADVLDSSPSLLIWRGVPTSKQRQTAADLCLLVAHKRREPTGIHTPKQVAWAWAQLQQIPSFSKFLGWFVEKFSRGDSPAGIDAAFQFLQACEFGFARTLSAVSAILKDVEPSAEPNYEYFIAQLENWFRPPWMKELDEAGIPIPLAERLRPHLGQLTNRADALRALSLSTVINTREFDEIDRYIISSALD